MEDGPEWITISKKSNKTKIRKDVSWKKNENTITFNIENLVNREIPYVSQTNIDNRNIRVEWKSC